LSIEPAARDHDAFRIASTLIRSVLFIAIALLVILVILPATLLAAS